MTIFKRFTQASLLAAATTSAGLALAQEQGRVISTTPVITQVAVQRQVCTTEQVSSSIQQKSGAGAVVGGIAGGAVGNAMGNGNGRAAMTMIGIVGGAILGDKIEGSNAQPQTQNVQRCSNQTVYENKPTAYNVVYEFNGKQYHVQLPQDPGQLVNLQVTPVGGAPVTPAPAAPVIVRPVTQAPVYTQPVVIESYTTYVEPRTVYVRPAPVYVRPAPVFVAAQPVYHVRPRGHAHGLRHGHNGVSISYNGYYR